MTTLGAPAPRAMAPRYGWLTWSPVVIALLVLIDMLTLRQLPLLSLIIVWLVLMVLNAVRLAPRRGSIARQRSPLLALLLAPLLGAMIGSPITGIFQRTSDPAHLAPLLSLQYAMLYAALLVPLALMAVMPGGRRFTLVLGLIALLITAIAVSVNLVILAPGS